ncbi:predicted protein [Aspergillus nidulans FGSC A4]|uniref:Uncharacterized protein n=1 Tax=Emericella nidulans (strain FGSC A4 / ATCC 38163 / CBS 112.46 / NRRL 194 / M139) TaxID=227321 RepID=Q5B7S9_EMENI|nr:hypothetical protein [Aspergillus nidulans FGSC A4]EAA63369.1 predicted protein [Aspergillus nidulans FGSC A4]CBF82780.1 TPA: conserved hypothetical protein [Aspergillus nidulans FGSC A4]|eukprot:XP_661005.1 predicted protein [Aspergillus nidulans FGSC A4]
MTPKIAQSLFVEQQQFSMSQSQLSVADYEDATIAKNNAQIAISHLKPRRHQYDGYNHLIAVERPQNMLKSRRWQIYFFGRLILRDVHQTCNPALREKSATSGQNDLPWGLWPLQRLYHDAKKLANRVLDSQAIKTITQGWSSGSSGTRKVHRS